MEKRFPKVCDLVSVNIKHVEYYGYVDSIDYDLRHPSICVEFFPGSRSHFDLSDITIVNYPKPV